MNKDFLYRLVNNIPNKDTAKYTTSKKFKTDLIDYFTENKFYSCIELGSCQGNSTLLFSYLFDVVLGIEWDDFNLNISRERCKDRENIKIEKFDVTNNWSLLPENIDVINLDALHDVHGVRLMIDNAIHYYPNSIIIMDDYGHEDGFIKIIIDELINLNKISVLKWIGENKGFIAANKKVFVDKEGLIFKFK